MNPRGVRNKVAKLHSEPLLAAAPRRTITAARPLKRLPTARCWIREWKKWVLSHCFKSIFHCWNAEKIGD